MKLESLKRRWFPVVDTQSRSWIKSVAAFAVLLQINFQISAFFPIQSFAAEAITEQPVLLQENLPEKNISSNDLATEPVQDSTNTDVGFLINSSSITPVDAQIEENVITVELEENDNPEEFPYSVDIYQNAQDGIYELQTDLASAYLAQSLNIDDLEVLRQHENEVGLLVAGDVIVVYSTGDEHFIRNLLPVKNLIEDPLVVLSAHFHKDGPPSEIDFENAVENLLKREVEEEAGIKIDDKITYINSVAFVRPDGIPVILVKFAARYKSGDVVLEKGAFTDFAWVDEKEINNYQCIEEIKEEVLQTIKILSRK